MNENSWASALLAEPSCAVEDNKLLGTGRAKYQVSEASQTLSVAKVFLWFTAQLGHAKIALALLLRVIFFNNHSRRVYLVAMPGKTLIITALQCEAAPLIKALHAKPLREDPCAERFQVFHTEDTYIATSGIGKVRSAIATTALLTSLFPHAATGDTPPLVANIGIAGSSTTTLPIGTLTYINKVRDVATNTRFYPDILVKHTLPESALDTYDAPVTTPPTETVTVDMEGAGFIQAATALGAPSSICLLKVISDHCSGERISPALASALIEQNAEKIHTTLHTIHATLPTPVTLSASDRSILEDAATHAKLSLTQRIELTRRIKALHARGIPWGPALRIITDTTITTKETRNAAYNSLLHALAEVDSL